MTRWGYRIAEISELTGLPRSTVDAHAERAGVPRRKIGEAVVLEARAVERVFGFDPADAAPPDDTALDAVRRLLA